MTDSGRTPSPDPADYTGNVGITQVRPKLVIDYADPKVKITLAALVRSDPTFIDVWGSELTIGSEPEGAARYRVVGYDPESHCLLADLIAPARGASSETHDTP